MRVLVHTISLLDFFLFGMLISTIIDATSPSACASPYKISLRVARLEACDSRGCH